mmetsp:Transcript_1897/g.2880  ORF Transcript_1897/g.2880 Transcript_1897/m.2880 type:complete len:392 (+) Transcript_1897:53-1228(+)
MLKKRSIAQVFNAEVDSLRGKKQKGERSDIDVELKNLLANVRLDKNEMRCRKDLERRVLRVAESVWPQVRMEIFGSHGSATEHYDSDLDIRLHRTTVPSIACWKMRHALLESGWTRQIETRPRARIPIVCFTDIYTDISVDISFGCTVDSAVDTSNSNDWFSGSDPLFFDLVLLMKLYFKYKNLDKPYFGGIGSFRLAVLIKEFFSSSYQSQQAFHNEREQQENKYLSTHILINDLFQFMAFEFDYLRHTLVVRNRQSRALEVTYGNVNVYLLRTACCNALRVLKSSEEPILPRIFGPSAWTAIHSARLEKLNLAKAYVKSHLTTAKIPPPSSYIYDHESTLHPDKTFPSHYSTLSTPTFSSATTGTSSRNKVYSRSSTSDTYTKKKRKKR